jgi:hypothetical protein
LLEKHMSARYLIGTHSVTSMKFYVLTASSCWFANRSVEVPTFSPNTSRRCGRSLA